MMFWGFRSRWMTPPACAVASAPAICIPTCRVCAGDIAPDANDVTACLRPRTPSRHRARRPRHRRQTVQRCSGAKVQRPLWLHARIGRRVDAFGIIVRKRRKPHHLNGDRPVQSRIGGSVDGPHSAAGQHVTDRVGADRILGTARWTQSRRIRPVNSVRWRVRRRRPLGDGGIGFCRFLGRLRGHLGSRCIR